MSSCNRPATLATQSLVADAVAAAVRVAPTCGAAAASHREGKTVVAHSPLYPYTDCCTEDTVAVAVVGRSCKTVVVGLAASVVAVCAAWNRSWRDRGGTHCAVS